VLMGLLAIGAAVDGAWIIVVFAVSAVVTVADNGLAYTSVAELGGQFWAGRALGIHNTSQNLTSLLAAPMLAGVISGSSYAWGFALTAVFPLLAIPLTPVRAETASAPELVRPNVDA
jgi:MFS family permease